MAHFESCLHKTAAPGRMCMGHVVQSTVLSVGTTQALPTPDPTYSGCSRRVNLPTVANTANRNVQSRNSHDPAVLLQVRCAQLLKVTTVHKALHAHSSRHAWGLKLR